MHLRSHIPNWLTYFRILVILPLVGTILQNTPSCFHIATILFFLAALSDFLDGYLARLWNVGSSMGRLLDPVADKMVVAAALVALVHTGHAAVWPTILIIFRELFVSGLREFLIERRAVLPVSRLAKYKTAAQLVAIFTLLLGEAVSLPHIHTFGSILLWASAALTLITGVGYFTSSLKTIHAKE